MLINEPDPIRKMKLIPIKKSEIPSGRSKTSKYRELLETFIESNNEAAKIDGAPLKVSSAAAQLRRYAKNSDQAVSIRVSGQDIYLVREK